MANARKRSSLLRQAVSWVGLAVAVAYIYGAQSRDLSEIGAIELHWGRLFLATALFGVIYTLFGVTWHLCLTGMGGQVGLILSLRHWYVGNLMKYVPGKVLTLLARLERFQALGVPMRVIGAAFAAETLLLVSSGFVLFGLCALLLPSASDQVVALGLAGSLVLLLLLHPRVFGAVTDRLQRRVTREPLPLVMPGPRVALAFGVVMTTWLLSGLCFALLCSAIAPCAGGYTAGNTLGLAGLNAFTWVVGVAAPFVPAGLGVKEGLLRVTAADFFSPAQAGVIAVAARVWMTAADLLGTGSLVLIDTIRQYRRRKEREQHDDA